MFALRIRHLVCLLALQVVLGGTTFSQTSGLYKVSLEKRVAEADLIVEGRVTGSSSFQDQTTGRIYTSNDVQVWRRFKGQLTSEIIQIITLGGVVGFQAEVVRPALALAANDTGLFFLTRLDDQLAQGATVFEAFSDQQGFVRYAEKMTSASDPFDTYPSIDTDLINRITAQTFTPPVVIRSPEKEKEVGPKSILVTPAITSFSPSTITAGTGNTLTIEGSGFGTFDGGATSGVLFSNPDNGGFSLIRTIASDVVSWTDTQIQIRVPDAAGTGIMGVTNSDGLSGFAASDLTVPYSIINIISGGQRFAGYLADRNGAGGMTLTFSTNTASSGVNFSTSPAAAPFLRALSTWQGATGLNVRYDGATTTVNAPSTSDGQNVMMFDNSSNPLPSGVLGRATSGFSTCDGVNWYVNGFDIVFKRDGTGSRPYNYGPDATVSGETDFESLAAHELGHGHQLDHVIDDARMMNFALQEGEDQRVPHPSVEVAGGNYVMNRSSGFSTCSGTVTGMTPYAGVTPVSLQVNSVNPSSGVAVSVSPNDENGNSNGVTSFSRQYNPGTSVQLNVSSPPSGKTVSGWNCSNGSSSSSSSVSFSIGSATTCTVTLANIRTLSVASQNPNSGVSVTVSPADLNGNSNGSTGFSRLYVDGATPTLTAPLLSGGNVFSSWSCSNGLTTSSRNVQPQLNSNVTCTAQYQPIRTLQVNANVSTTVTATPPDINGNGGGAVPFSRQYASGASVTLTAPATVSSRPFNNWACTNGENGTSRTLNLTLNSDAVCTATYDEDVTLTVASVNPNSGVTITSSTADLDGRTSGQTSFSFRYLENQNITLTAPNRVGNQIFEQWTCTVGGNSPNPVRTYSVTSDATCTAQYESGVTLDVHSDPVVSITVTPTDVNGNSGGTTPFSRLFAPGQAVQLAAPATVAGRPFDQWVCSDGTTTTTRTLDVTVNVNTLCTASYEPAYTLSIVSVNPNSGVSIVSSVPDLDGQTSGETAFTFRYLQGVGITFTAPDRVGDQFFEQWTCTVGGNSANRVLTYSVTSDAMCTARYQSGITLTVISDPAVVVAVSPTDLNGDAGALSPFSRLYTPGSSVQLTAAAESGGRPFEAWTCSSGSTSPVREIEITLTQSLACTASYRGTVALEVLASPNVSVNIAPNDLNGLSSGDTPLSRTFLVNQQVSLEAPVSKVGRPFDRWSCSNGFESASTSIPLVLDENITCEAGYLELFSLSVTAPQSAGAVAVQVFSNGSTESVLTPFQRDYPEGTAVRLTAPAESGLAPFSAWACNPAGSSSQRVINLLVSGPTSCSVLFSDLVNLTVQTNPAGLDTRFGVSSQDLGGLSSADNPAVFVFPENATTHLTAEESFVSSSVFYRFESWGCSNGQEGGELSLVPDLTNDLTCTAGYTLVGDFDGNSCVDLPDLIAFGNVYGAVSTDPAYDPVFDFDVNGLINLLDFTFFADSYHANCGSGKVSLGHTQKSGFPLEVDFNADGAIISLVRGVALEGLEFTLAGVGHEVHVMLDSPASNGLVISRQTPEGLLVASNLKSESTSGVRLVILGLNESEPFRLKRIQTIAGNTREFWDEMPADDRSGSEDLMSIYPNPFTSSLTIRYVLSEAEYVKLDLFDLLGRQVEVLADGFTSAGTHEVDFQTDHLRPGVYVVVLTAGSDVTARQIIRRRE